MAYLDETGLRRVAEKVMKKPVNAGTTDQILRQNENGDPYWADPASASEIATATSAWLEDNISGISETILLDTSLVTSGAAADAAAAGAIIKVSSTQPTESSNRLWVDSGEVEEIEVPTMDDHEALQTEVDDLTELLTLRVPQAPTTTGTYTLKAVSRNGTTNYAWVLDV